MTEYYVPTETQMSFIRSERDLRLSAVSYRKRVGRVMDVRAAPKVTEHKVDDYGRPFLVHLHAETGMVLEVTEI